MARLMIKRRGETVIQPDGIWTGAIGFQCPWAHPVWSEYLLLVYDLAGPDRMGKPAMKLNPAATHEFVLSAIAPDTPIDFDKSIYDQKTLSPLTPANCGYQFKAESNDAAWTRVNELIDACFREVTPGIYALNPDSDFRSQWDHKMQDGWTLLQK